MPVETPERYEVWNPNSIPVPPRSRLYPLEPIGLGTPYVESLTSYIARLAEAHSLSWGMLMTHEIAPLLYVRIRFSQDRPGVAGISGLNGTGPKAARTVDVLERLTHRADLRFLTLLPYARVLPPIGLLRPERAWCSACYQEWQDTEAPLYDPLLWALKVAAVCPRHRRPLSFRCPCRLCGYRSHPLRRRTRPGYCSRCGGWLGIRPSDQGKPSTEASGEALEEHIWAARAIGEILVAAPALPAPPGRKIVTASLATCINRVTRGSPCAFAKLLEVPSGQVSAWRTGGILPRLGTLLSICRVSGITLRDFLSGTALTGRWKTQSGFWRAPLPRPTRRNSVNILGLKGALEQALADPAHPSLAQVAYRIGHDPKTLRAHYAAMCREITRRHGTHGKRKRLQEKRRLRKGVRGAVRALYDVGVYPSSRRVAIFLGKRGYRRNNDFYDEWKRMMRRLGPDTASSRRLERRLRPEPKS